MNKPNRWQVLCKAQGHTGSNVNGKLNPCVKQIDQEIALKFPYDYAGKQDQCWRCLCLH